jgi:hypothetical protein
MRKAIILILSVLIFCIEDSGAQQSGRIYFRDSTILEITEFTALRSELYYYRKSNNNRNKENASVDLTRNYSIEKIRRISFKYEKGRGNDQFSYQLLIEGINPDGSLYKKKIKTWDWLEMSTPESGSVHDTEIIFYTEKKRLDIVRIEFD